MKQTFQVDDDSMDFGFSTVSEAELKTIEKKLLQEVESKEVELEKIEKDYKSRLQKLHKMIIPLLNNLSKDPEKEYIHWPNRTKKIEEFRKKIDRLIEE